MRTSQRDLKDIVKEISALGGKIDKLEKIVEGRLVGEVRLAIPMSFHSIT